MAVLRRIALRSGASVLLAAGVVVVAVGAAAPAPATVPSAGASSQTGDLIWG
ncbi:hypothetical protein [Kitasatospora camelliae]|uniref:Uncharacterized protein n=1 Tax=Kitasatospora camelliae TaxID=3156397 RepID=A0AAU8K478_9ACTN